MLLAFVAPLPAFSPADTASTSKHAAISVVDTLSKGLKRVAGVAKTRAEPLLVQDTPWEPRLDNGYPNVVPPESPKDPWQLWYGDCVKGCGTQVLLYANLTDGLTWEKPNLGLFDVGTVRPDLKAIGKANNIVLEGGGIGIYRDPRATDPSRKYVAFGPGCYTASASESPSEACNMMWSEAEEGGVRRVQAGAGYPRQDLAFSSDGLRWSDATAVTWPSPQRYDCHNNLFRVASSGKYAATTRDGFSAAPGRAIGIALSPNASLEFNTKGAPRLTLGGSLEYQLYSQITFAWLDIFLGIVMVFDAQDPDGRVHCRLAWAPGARTPADADATATATATATTGADADNTLPVPLGPWAWVEGDGGLTGTETIPLGADGAFDSHVCFAAASPVTWQGEERIYYMGGNGPHSGERNSSLGLATLRQDGFAAVSGSGTLVTVELLVTGPWLTATVDVHDGAAGANGGSVRLGLRSGDGPAGLAADKAVPFTSNRTDAHVSFEGGADFSSLIGTKVVLEAQLDDAMLYSVGFAPRG